MSGIVGGHRPLTGGRARLHDGEHLPRSEATPTMMDDPDVLRLTLYVAGRTPRAERALANLRRIVELELHMPFELEIIDVLERPDLAEDALILATPTLVKESPLPGRRLIGDLSDTHRVMAGLHLPSPTHMHETAGGNGEVTADR